MNLQNNAAPLTPRPSITVIYHDKCADGFGAAFAAWLKLKDTAEYLPFNYEMPAPDLTGQDVYMVDFAFSAEQLDAISRQANSLTVLDHHVTAQRNLARFRPVCCGKIHIDLNRSGAMLAWQHFHPETPAPELIRHIEDRDLWKWEVPGSQAFLTWLGTLPFDFSVWEGVLNQGTEGYVAALKQGESMVTKFQSLVESIAKRAAPFELNGQSGWAVNCPPEFVSDVGSLLAQKHGSFAMLWSVRDSIVRCSLRSVKGIDVEKMALAFGGGGHEQAAAFTCKPEKLLEISQGRLAP